MLLWTQGDKTPLRDLQVFTHCGECMEDYCCSDEEAYMPVGTRLSSLDKPREYNNPMNLNHLEKLFNDIIDSKRPKGKPKRSTCLYVTFPHWSFFEGHLLYQVKVVELKSIHYADERIHKWIFERLRDNIEEEVNEYPVVKKFKEKHGSKIVTSLIWEQYTTIQYQLVEKRAWEDKLILEWAEQYWEEYLSETGTEIMIEGVVETVTEFKDHQKIEKWCGREF